MMLMIRISSSSFSLLRFFISLLQGTFKHKITDGEGKYLVSVYRNFNKEWCRSPYARSAPTHEPPFTVVNEGVTATVDYIFCR